VRPGQRFAQGVMEPLLGCMLLALGTVPVATGMMDPVLLAPAVALRAAVSGVSTAALLQGADGLLVAEREMRVACEILVSTGSADILAGAHGRRPCMSELMRWEVSSCPMWGRCQETIVVASRVCPRKRGLRRRLTLAASSWVA
jgi:hypothetical protein